MGYTPLQVIPPAAATPFDPAPYPTAVSFDPYADLLLVGSSSGTVTSYCSPATLERHAVYCAHGSKGFGTYSTMRMGFGTGEVAQLKVVEKEIWSLTEGGLAGARRGGLIRWNVRYITYPYRALSVSLTARLRTGAAAILSLPCEPSIQTRLILTRLSLGERELD